MSFAIKPMDPVNDFTAQVGGDVVKVLADQPKKSYADVLQDAFSTFNKLRQEEKVDNAIAYYDKELNKGRKVADILREIDPSIAGSDDFREPAHKINENYRQDRANARAEAQMANLFKRQAMSDEANALLADLRAYQARIPGGAAVWFKQNEHRLKSNPIAANLIMSTLQNTDLSLTSSPEDIENSTKTFEALLGNAGKNIETARQAVHNILSKASNLGLATDVQIQNSPYLKDINAFMDHNIKQQGLTGQDASDYKSNVLEFINNASRETDLPIEQILAQAERYQRPSLWSMVPLLGRYAQDVIDDAGLDQSKLLSESYSTLAPKVKVAETLKGKLDNAVTSGLVATVAQSANTKINKIKEAYSQSGGRMSTLERDQLIHKAQQEALTQIFGENLSALTVNELFKPIK